MGIDRSSGIYDLRVALTAALVAMLVVAVFVDVSPHKDFWLVLATAAQFATVARSLPRRTAAEPPVRTRHPELVEGRRSWVRRRPSVRNGSST